MAWYETQHNIKLQLCLIRLYDIQTHYIINWIHLRLFFYVLMSLPESPAVSQRSNLWSHFSFLSKSSNETWQYLFLWNVFTSDKWTKQTSFLAELSASHLIESHTVFTPECSGQPHTEPLSTAAAGGEIPFWRTPWLYQLKDEMSLIIHIPLTRFNPVISIYEQVNKLTLIVWFNALGCSFVGVI